MPFPKFLTASLGMSRACLDSVLTASRQAFENASTNIAAAQMRNTLTALSETVEDPEEKQVSFTPTKVCLPLEAG